MTRESPEEAETNLQRLASIPGITRVLTRLVNLLSK